MKDNLLVGLTPEEKKQLKNYEVQLDKVLDRYRRVIKQAYLAKEEESLVYSDAISNYAVKIAYINGYKAALLALLKLHSFDTHELIPDNERPVL